MNSSVRTKKRETVEDKLRQALGVPLAIGLPSKESEKNSSKSPLLPTHDDTDHNEKKRRSTVSGLPTNSSAKSTSSMLTLPFSAEDGVGHRRSTISAPGDHHLDIPLVGSIPNRRGKGSVSAPARDLGRVQENEAESEGLSSAAMGPGGASARDAAEDGTEDGETEEDLKSVKESQTESGSGSEREVYSQPALDLRLGREI